MTAPLPLQETSVRTRRLDSASTQPLELLDLLPDSDNIVSWLREGDGFIGWGEFARFEITGPTRFAAAQRWWDELVARMDINDEVRLPGTGPIAMVSMAYHDAPTPSVLVVPSVIIGQHRGTPWITTLGKSHPWQAAPPRRRPHQLRYHDGQLAVTDYRHAVSEAIRRMRANSLDKVVLAHDLVAAASEPVDPRFVLHGLATRYPSCWSFAADGLIGATPELLLSREGRRVRSRVLAGTNWPHADMSGAELEHELLHSAKDRAEHDYAVTSLAESLHPFCDSLSVPESPEVLRLHNVAHLASEITGVLPDTHGSAGGLLRLAEAVHPTAAVGGTPRREAAHVIGELETMDRGRYAGPVGWIDSHGDGELGIALRCAQLEDDGRQARLYAGCGIVADSDPDKEVREAEAKLLPIRQALEGALK